MKYFLIIVTLVCFSCSEKEKQNVEIKNAWIRNGAQGMNTALFFDVVNNGDEADTLYKAVSGLAGLVQIHETYTEGDRMGMREAGNVVIESNSTFSFRPRAHHVMLINLNKDLNEGDTGEVILYFKNAGEIKLNVPVKKMIVN